MRSARLQYRALTPARAGDFQRLMHDPHVRRYLLDGAVMPPVWCEQRASDSQALFASHGVGIWLSYDAEQELLGFCGFQAQADGSLALLYGMPERFTGHGYALEMARAAVAEVRATRAASAIVADVDEANAASLRVLEKLGFTLSGSNEGSFGRLLQLRLELTGPH